MKRLVAAAVAAALLGPIAPASATQPGLQHARIRATSRSPWLRLLGRAGEGHREEVKMRRSGRLTDLAAALTAGALVALGVPAASAAPEPGAYTCDGGSWSKDDFLNNTPPEFAHIPSGVYSSITIKGACDVDPDARIVAGNVNVADGGFLDAQEVSSKITVQHNVTAGAGALLWLGCQPEPLDGHSAHSCGSDPAGTATVTVNGDITATGSLLAMLNGIRVNGDVTLTGGGDPDFPWPIKNNQIGGNLTVSGMTVEWLGVMWNRVGRNMNLSDITMIDAHPDASHAAFVVRNTIGRDLNCSNIRPAVSSGFFPDANKVGRDRTGQCVDLKPVWALP